MRVLLATFNPSQTGAGGLSTYTHQLARWLSMENHEVMVAGYSWDSVVETPYPVLQFARNKLEYSLLTPLSMSLRFPLCLNKGLNGFRPEIIHVIDVYGWFIAVGSKVPVVYTLHNPLLPLCNLTHIGHNVGSLLATIPTVQNILFERICSVSARLIICPSIYSATASRRLYGLPGDKIRVVYNGIDLHSGLASKILKLKGQTRRDGTVRILCVVGAAPVKRVADLLLAMQQVARAERRAHLTVAGRGSRELRRTAETLGIQDRVSFIGWVEADELARHYAMSDIYVLPTLTEGLPFTVLEAMAAGLPVVACRVGGIPEVVRDRRTGLLCRPKDPRDLADKILALLQDRRLMRSMGEEGYRVVAEKFNVDSFGHGVVKVYEEAIRGS